jgi:hypothetical protein
MRPPDATLLRIAFDQFQDSFFTAADLLACADSSFELLAALSACLGSATVNAKHVGHHLRRLNEAHHGALELRSLRDGHLKKWRFQVVERVPLDDAQKAELRSLAVVKPHETPTGVRALKRLGKAIEQYAADRQERLENFEKLERKIADINQIPLEVVHMIKDEAWMDVPEEDPFAPPPTTQELVVRDSQPLVEAVESLTVPQREFLECLVESRYDTVKARQTYRDTFGKALPTATLSAWMTEENFIKAVQVRESIAAKIHGVSLAAVYADLADIKRRNIGTNDRLALSALEMLAKALGAFKQAEERTDIREGPNLTIQVMSKDGSVQINMPGAEGRVIPCASVPERRAN